MPQRTMRRDGRAPLLFAATFRCLILVAVVSVSVLLGACSGPPPPPGLCDSRGEAPPPVVPYAEPVTAPAVANGVVYIGFSVSTDGSHFQTSIAAFHASDGSLIWQRQDPIGSASLVAGGDVLILSSATTLAALRTSDGAVQWQLPRGSYAGLFQRMPNGNSWIDGPQLVLDAGMLYAIDGSGLYAVRVSNGQVLWQVPPPDDRVVIPFIDAHYPHLFGPLVSGDTVYLSSLNGPVVAVRASDGALLWQTFVEPPTTGNGGPTQPPPTQVHPLAAVRDALFVATDRHAVVQLRSGDGSTAEDLEPPAGTPAGLVQPLVVDGVAYLGVTQVRGSDSTYILLDARGRQLWQVSLEHVVPGGVAAQDHGLLFLFGGHFGAVRLADGAVLWQSTLLPHVNIVAAGQLYMSTSGVRDRCHRSYSDIIPELIALNETTGGLSWVRMLESLH